MIVSIIQIVGVFLLAWWGSATVGLLIAQNNVPPGNFIAIGVASAMATCGVFL